MRRLALPYLLCALPLCALSLHAATSDLALACQGKTRFIHRGAASTYPQDEKRHYLVHDLKLDNMQCSVVEGGLACMGLTEQQAMRRVQIDTTAHTVSDTLQMPTSELIFEGHCDKI